MLAEDKVKIIIDTLKAYHPSLIGVFGSYARGEQTDDSDIDILVNLKGRINLFELIKLEEELSNLLGIKVDLITKNSLNEYLKDIVEEDLIYLLNE